VLITLAGRVEGVHPPRPTASKLAGMFSYGNSFGSSAACIDLPGVLTRPAPPWKLGTSPETMLAGLRRV
jgi:hypothetical protein